MILALTRGLKRIGKSILLLGEARIYPIEPNHNQPTGAHHAITSFSIARLHLYDPIEPKNKVRIYFKVRTE